MPILEVLTFPDPRLRKVSQPVAKVGPEQVEFSNAMLETMYSFKGIGLAAPQVNRLDRIVVIDTRAKDEEDRYDLSDLTDLEKKVPQPLILFNPVIVATEGNTTYDEGCLSVPSYYETVERFDVIECEALNQKGETIKFKTDGLLSICIQHEIDHLDGKLFIDRLSTVKAGRIKKQIKKRGYPERKKDPEASEKEGVE